MQKQLQNNKKISETATFKKLQHREVQFDNEFFEIAICEYGNKLSEVYLIHQMIPKPTRGSEYDVSSKNRYSQIRDKPYFVKKALEYAKRLEVQINKELSEGVNQ